MKAETCIRERSAGFQTCCVADFQIGGAGEFVSGAGLETRDTADLEVCATVRLAQICLRHVHSGFKTPAARADRKKQKKPVVSCPVAHVEKHGQF